jgi:D-tyrosyl-tRNA(Tyr) deacylase
VRALLQRVRQAAVDVEGRQVGAIGRGFLVLLAVGREDGEEDVNRLAEKIVELRVFPDDARSMNRSLKEVGGEILLISQFTLYADTQRGRRPSFEPAAEPAMARRLYEEFAARLAQLGFPPQKGVFGTHMLVRLENDGPVTLILES